MNIQKNTLIAKFKDYRYNTPNNAVPNGPVCGNGDIGVAMDAGNDCARLWIGKNDFWCYNPFQYKGGVRCAGMVSLLLRDMHRAAFSAWQDAACAVVGADFAKDGVCAHLTATAPRGNKLVLMELSCEGGALEYDLRLDTPSSDPMAWIERESAEGRMRLTKAYTRNGVDYPCIAALELVAYQGELSGRLEAGEKACFVLAVVTDADAPQNCVAMATELADAVNADTAAALRAASDAWWDEFWSASQVSLPDHPDVEHYWYLSHYIMACCSDPESYAPGLFGNFITSDTPNWGGDYHLNYNHEAPFWGLCSSNHVAEADAYHRPVLEYVDRARQNAREQLDCRGLYSKVGIGPRGYECSALFNEDGSPDEVHPYYGQKSNSIYAGINFIMRYYYTMDEDYLREIAYPYLREVGLFWVDYLRYENGRYVDYGDCVHESHDGNDMNPVLTLGLLRTTLRALIDMSGRLSVDEELRAQWQDRLDKLSDYSTHEMEGREVFRYTERGMAWWDNNSLGVQHIYPGGAITLDSDARMLKLATDTLEVMGRWEDYNAFPTFYTAAVRIGYDPDVILTQMQKQLKLHGYANGFVYYGGGGIECCSTVPSAVNDMFVQNYAGKLRLFPVWNRAHDASFENLRAYGALLVSGAVSGGEVQPAKIVSEKSVHVCIVSPWESGAKVLLGGEVVSEGMQPEFDAMAGGEYTVVKA